MARKYRNFVYDENQRFIYPTSDWGFKYLLGTEENKGLLIGILNRLLPELNIESLDYLPRDITIPVGKMKDACFDVHCKLHDGSSVVIEMQNYAKPVFIDRALIYTSAAVLSHYVNLKGKDYHIGKTIFIAFTGDPLFKKVSRTPIRMALCDIDESLTTVRNDKVLQIFVELPKFAGSLQEIDENTPFVEKLAYVLMEMADCEHIPDNLNDSLLEGMFKAADTGAMEKDKKENYMKSILGEAEYEANLYEWREEGLSEGRAEGLAKGLAEGHAEGLAEGHAEGLAEGHAEGHAEGLAEGLAEGHAEGHAEGLAEGIKKGEKAQSLKDAAKFKAAGVSTEVIASCTGLPLSEVEAL